MANNNNNNKGTPAHLRQARLQRIRAEEEELERVRREELRQMEEERVRIQNGMRAVEEEQEKVRLEQEKRIREEQEARSARVAEDARLRAMQQPVAGASDDVIDGVGTIFNDFIWRVERLVRSPASRTSGVLCQRLLRQARRP